MAEHRSQSVRIRAPRSHQKCSSASCLSCRRTKRNISDRWHGLPDTAILCICHQAHYLKDQRSLSERLAHWIEAVEIFFRKSQVHQRTILCCITSPQISSFEQGNLHRFQPARRHIQEERKNRGWRVPAHRDKAVAG